TEDVLQFAFDPNILVVIASDGKPVLGYAVVDLDPLGSKHSFVRAIGERYRDVPYEIYAEDPEKSVTVRSTKLAFVRSFGRGVLPTTNNDGRKGYRIGAGVLN